MDAKTNSHCDVLFKCWLTMTSGFCALGWGLSAVHGLGLFHLLSWIWAAVVSGYGISRYKRREQAGAERCDPLRFFPFLLVLALIFISGIWYLPAIHDSLAYRIPRLYLWLGTGGISWFEFADSRINNLGTNWEWSALPFLIGGSERFLFLPSFVSWVFLYAIFATWAGWAGTADSQVKKWIGLICASGVVFVLEASTTLNDLFACGFIALSMHFVWMSAGESDATGNQKSAWENMLWSGLALALATGTKPNYVMLAPAWLAAAGLILRGQWAAIPKKRFACFFSAALIVCCLPTFFFNYYHTGSVTGFSELHHAEYASFKPSTPFWGMLYGNTMMVWQSFQPPVNPLAGAWNGFIVPVIDMSGIRELLPRFSLDAKLFAIVDGGSALGMATSVFLSAGILAALIRRGPGFKQYLWTMLSSLFLLCLAFCLVVPHAVGRSFVGFLIPAFPLAMLGLCSFSTNTIKAMGWISVCVVLVLVVIEPHRPLWPAEYAQDLLSRRMGGNKESRLLSSLVQYNGFRDRRECGKDLFEAIPADTKRVGIVYAVNCPVASAWHVPGRKWTIEFFGPTDLDLLFRSGIDYFVVTELSEKELSAFRRKLDADSRFDILDEKRYTSKLRTGPLSWMLFRKDVADGLSD